MSDVSPLARGRALDSRRISVAVVLGVALIAAWHLKLGSSLAALFDIKAELWLRFVEAAFTPALDYESSVPADTPPLLLKACEGARQTALFALTGISAALLIGLPLGILCARSFWYLGTPYPCTAPAWGRLGWNAARGLAAALRSMHELLYAILLLAAFGWSEFVAVIAIALPYGGTLAKVFSELVDETPQHASRALAASGTSRALNFFVTRVPAALPQLTAYAFYRFECALRSAAVLGFFGLPTLGFLMAQAFENLHLRELWTYLYTLLICVYLTESWSAAVRRRLVA